VSSWPPAYVIDSHDLRLMLRLYESSPHPTFVISFRSNPVRPVGVYVSPKTEGRISMWMRSAT